MTCVPVRPRGLGVALEFVWGDEALPLMRRRGSQPQHVLGADNGEGVGLEACG